MIVIMKAEAADLPTAEKNPFSSHAPQFEASVTIESNLHRTPPPEHQLWPPPPDERCETQAGRSTKREREERRYRRVAVSKARRSTPTACAEHALKLCERAVQSRRKTNIVRPGQNVVNAPGGSMG